MIVLTAIRRHRWRNSTRPIGAHVYNFYLGKVNKSLNEKHKLGPKQSHCLDRRFLQIKVGQINGSVLVS